jgi:hypothetical protein
MNFHFYMKGGVTPAAYDFDLSLGGQLLPSNLAPPRSMGRVLILLENGGPTPTLAQMTTINDLCTINPGWESTFHFQTGRLEH